MPICPSLLGNVFSSMFGHNKVMVFPQIAIVGEDYCKSFCFGQGCSNFVNGRCNAETMTMDEFKAWLNKKMETLKGRGIIPDVFVLKKPDSEPEEAEKPQSDWLDETE